MASKKKESATPDEIRERHERAYDTIVKTPEGLMVLRHIMQVSNYQGSIIRTNPTTGEVNPIATTYGVALRDMWSNIRSYLSPEQRSLIENGED